MSLLKRLFSISILTIILAGAAPSTAHAQQSDEHRNSAPALTAVEPQEASANLQPLDIELDCAGHSSRYLIWTYERDGGGPGDDAYLRCGSSGWGLRHIERDHESDWYEYAVLVAADWEDIADYAIEQTLANPSSVRYRPSTDTWRFRGPIEIRNLFGEVVAEFVTRVVVADNSENIITAFPE
jgi:hypothetical protein